MPKTVAEMANARDPLANWWHRLWSSSPPGETSGPDLQQMVNSLGVSRRASLRVKFPVRQDAEFWPRISFNNCPLKIYDLSTGGACLLDPDSHLGEAVGHSVHIHLAWPGEPPEKVEARLVACGHIQRNIQFANLSMASQLRIHELTRPALWGQRLRRSSSESAQSWLEMWLGVTGESVVFLSYGEVQINFEKVQIRVPISGPPVYEQHPKALKGRALLGEDRLKVALMLSNVDQPSVRLSQLLEVFL